MSLIGDFRRNNNSLKARTISSLIVLAGGDLYGHILRLLSNLILTRLLFPEAFGIMLVVNVVLIGANAMTDAGIKPAFVVMSRKNEQAHIETAWSLTLIRGGIIAFLIILFAKPISIFYGQPVLFGLLIATSVAPFFQGLISPQVMIYERDVRQSKIVLVELISATASSVVTVLLVLVFPSVWSLVAGLVFSTVFHCILSYVIFPFWKPVFRIDQKIANAMFHFGKWIFASTFLGFLVSSGDKLLVSLMITTEELGVFSIAIALAKMPEFLCRKISFSLLLPVYTELINQNSGEYEAKAKKVRLLLYVIAWPAMMTTSIFGQEIVMLLYDDRYADAGWMLEIMSLGALFAAFSNTISSLLIANGNSRAFTVSQFIQVASLIITISLGGSIFGLYGIVYAIAFSPAVSYFSIVAYASRHEIPVHTSDIALIFAPILIVISIWHFSGWPGTI